MKTTYKAAMTLALLSTFVLGVTERGRACEPNSSGFGGFCVCEPSGFELSGACYEVGTETVRRGMMNIAQPYDQDSRLEFIAWKITSPTGEFMDQYITLARGDNACAAQTPGNTGNGCKALFNVGQPPTPPTLLDIPSLGWSLLDVPGRRQNVFFNVECDTLALGGADLTGVQFRAVAIVGFSRNGEAGTCRVNNVKVQERPAEGEEIQPGTACP